ncbi:Aste57867_1007 [Aphanomyces stellatus]|uniref:Aste57867_1007 protein n=1 Tax=Aphanomyces stellatus TaxID=120398 RepID=A0A485K7E7_9STRA|nr:hypothetical protein As57867_001006 [Aphanomyces stellatus]VFT78229.1 Aste57867_1007 [Aphanomyces stellatus]
MEHLDNCVVQMRACANKLRSSKIALSSAYLEMKGRELPPILTKSRLVFEMEEKEEDVMEKNRRRFDACIKQAEDMTEKLLAEKKQLEKEIRRQSQQFRQVLEERDADVQIEYAKMLNELNDHLTDAKQQLDSAIQIRDSKTDLVKNLPSPSLATEADLHDYHTLQQQVAMKTNEVSALHEQFLALEEELTRPIKRKADALDESQSAANYERELAECKELQGEIELLNETEQNFKDQANQRRLLEIQQEENAKLLDEIEAVEQEKTNVENTLEQLSIRLQSQFRVLAATSASGALMTRLYSLVTGTQDPIALGEFLQLCPNQAEGMEAIDLLVQVGVVELEGMQIRKIK